MRNLEGADGRRAAGDGRVGRGAGRRRRLGDGGREGLELADVGGVPRVRPTTMQPLGRRVSLCTSSATRRRTERARRLLLRLHQGMHNTQVINVYLD